MNNVAMTCIQVFYRQWNVSSPFKPLHQVFRKKLFKFKDIIMLFKEEKL